MLDWLTPTSNRRGVGASAADQRAEPSGAHRQPESWTRCRCPTSGATTVVYSAISCHSTTCGCCWRRGGEVPLAFHAHRRGKEREATIARPPLSPVLGGSEPAASAPAAASPLSLHLSQSPSSSPAPSR